MNLHSEAKALVERARLGDQNAQAMIFAVRLSAEKGSPRAQEAAKAIYEVLKNGSATPKQLTSEFAAEPLRELKAKVAQARKIAIGEDDGNAEEVDCDVLRLLCSLERMGGVDAMVVGAVILANGAELTDTRVKEISSALNEESEALFAYGLAFPCAGTTSEICRAGQCVGHARTLQMARKRDTPITPFSPTAGKELDI
jgi:hypothetical protein